MRDVFWDENTNPVRVLPEAFRPGDDGISVTWVEHFGGSFNQALGKAREAIGRGLTLRPSHRLAKLKVGSIVALGETSKSRLAVIHDPVEEPPEKVNLGHSLIVGVQRDDENLKNLLARAVLSLELAIADRR
jgi:hypothetical protein